MFERVGLIGRHGDERVVKTLRQLVDYLQRRSTAILLDANTATALPSFGLDVADRATLGRDCDLVFIVGGDGTFLHAARDLVDYDVRLIGINLGRLGFLTDITPNEMPQHLDAIFAGDFAEEMRFLLCATIERGGETVAQTIALNDIVTHKWNIARLVRFETFINGRLVNSQRSDGLIVATPTGSTAYALSGGGPILHPSLDAIVLVPICPHTLSSRPIVVDADSEIDIVMGESDEAQAQLTSDGQTVMGLEPGDRIQVRKKQPLLHLIHPPGHDHYATLRAKLHWGREL